MTLRFQIAEAHVAARPVVVLIGEVLEGCVRAGDRVSVPLADGTRFVGTVFGILRGWPDTRVHSSTEAGDLHRSMGLGVSRPDRHHAGDIAPGIVSLA